MLLNFYPPWLSLYSFPFLYSIQALDRLQVTEFSQSEMFYGRVSASTTSSTSSIPFSVTASFDNATIPTPPPPPPPPGERGVDSSESYNSCESLLYLITLLIIPNNQRLGMVSTNYSEYLQPSEGDDTFVLLIIRNAWKILCSFCIKSTTKENCRAATEDSFKSSALEKNTAV